MRKNAYFFSGRLLLCFQRTAGVLAGAGGKLWGSAFLYSFRGCGWMVRIPFYGWAADHPHFYSGNPFLFPLDFPAIADAFYCNFPLAGEMCEKSGKIFEKYRSKVEKPLETS